jgi:hypothetical protein
MGIVETPEKSNEQAAPTPAPATEAAPTAAPAGDIPVLQGKLAALEAKVKSLEEAAIKSAHDRINAIEVFLKSKYPYSL